MQIIISTKSAQHPTSAFAVLHLKHILRSKDDIGRPAAAAGSQYMLEQSASRGTGALGIFPLSQVPPLQPWPQSVACFCFTWQAGAQRGASQLWPFSILII